MAFNTYLSLQRMKVAEVVTVYRGNLVQVTDLVGLLKTLVETEGCCGTRMGIKEYEGFKEVDNGSRFCRGWGEEKRGSRRGSRGGFK